MNRNRRKELGRAIELMDGAKKKIEAAQEIIQYAADEEQEAYDNLPEGVQYSERGEAISENVDSLQDISSEVEMIGDNIDEQIHAVLEVIER